MVIQDLFGIKGLSYDMAKNGLPLLSKAAQNDVTTAETAGKEDLLKALLRHKGEILMALGLAVPGEDTVHPLVKSAVTEYLQHAGNWATNRAAIIEAEGNQPNNFYVWLNKRYRLEDELERLYNKYGECTPAVACHFEHAPEGMPLSLQILNELPTSIVIPEVSPNFAIDYMEDSNKDIQDAIMESYIYASLKTVLGGNPTEAMSRYRARGLRNVFPILVWDMAGRTYNQTEASIFVRGY